MKLKGLTRIFRLLVVVAAVLAFWGWYAYDDISEPGSAVWSAAYKTLQTYIFEVDLDDYPAPVPLMIAVFLAPLSLAGSIVIYFLRLTGNQLQARIVSWTYEDHIVVMGDTPASRVLVESHDMEGSTRIVFAVPQDADIPQEVALRGNAVVIHGDCTSAETTALTRMDHARAVFVFPSNEGVMEDYARAIVTAYGEGRRRSGSRRVHASFAVNAGSMDEVFSTFSGVLSRSYAGQAKEIEFTTFSLDARLARVLAEKTAPHATKSRDFVRSQRLQLVIHGFGSFVERYILEAAQLYHYSTDKTISIAVITDKEIEYTQFIEKHPGLAEVLTIQRYSEYSLSKWVRKPESVPFLSDPYRVVVWSEDMWEIPRLARDWRRVLLPERGKQDDTVPVTFVLPFEERMTEVYHALTESLGPLCVELLALRDLLRVPLLVEDAEEIDTIARQIHESYQSRFGAEPWEALTDWEKSFNRRSAAHLKIKLWFLGYAISNESDSFSDPVMLPEISEEERHFLSTVEHRRWVAEKLLDDFIPGRFPRGGEVDDPQAEKNRYKKHLRIHEDIRPFSELSESDKKKDEATFADLQQILRQVLTKERLVRIN